MDELERKLAWELRPAEPPSGFADGVMARLVRRRRARARKMRAWMAAVALLCVLAGSAAVERQHRRHVREEFARQQFDLAMQVTGRTISQAQEEMSRVGFNSSEVEQ